MLWCLYTIENQVNGKQYIGISSNVARRWLRHKSGQGSKLVYQAIKKYGLDLFKFDILCEGCEEDIKKLEIAVIEKLSTIAPRGYNLTAGGEGVVGYRHSEETRRKMGESRTGKRNGMHDKKHSEEARRKMGESHTGKRNGMHGKKHSEETRRKIAAKAKGRKQKGSAHPLARRVLVGGVEYGCIKDAAKAIGMKANALRARMSRYNKTSWPSGWRYLDE